MVELLISPTNLEEAKIAVLGGADIVDVKNPREGSLGANFPWVIREIKEVLPEEVKLSATIGDLDFKPGTASLAAYGLANLGIDYIKAGFYGIGKEAQGLELANALCSAVEGFPCRVVLAGYGDFERIGSLDPLLLPGIASESNAFGVMIDTAVKDGCTLLDHLEVELLEEFVGGAHERGLIAALAGSLGFSEVRRIQEVGPDIIGVRGAVCTGKDRMFGTLSAELIRELKEALDV